MKTKISRLRQFFVILLSTFIMIGASTNFSYGAKLYAFIVVMTNAPGTTMDDIRINAEVQDIAEVTRLELEKFYFKSSDAADIRRKVESLRCSSEDVILFYYSGHGGNSGDGWPTFSAQTKETEIHNILKGKGARLTITLYDCCNGGPTTQRPNVLPGVLTAYTLLFLNSTGDIKACSSSDGKPSYGYPNIGGFFTASFLKAIRDVPVANQAQQQRIWSNIKNLTYSGTNRLCQQNNEPPDNDHQNPKFAINVTTTPLGRVPNAPNNFVVGGQGYTDLKTPRDIITKYKGTSGHENLDLNLLKLYNDGVRKGYNGKTIKITNLDQILPSNKMIWLVQPW